MPCKLFVGGISAQTTTEALRGHFSSYGRLIDAVVMTKNGRPRGFGFVTYESVAPAVMALAEPQWLDGRLVDVKRAVPGERAQDPSRAPERASNKIFVGGLPQDVSTEDLKAYFGGYGAVADAVVMVDRRTNRSRGFGFVRFANGVQGSAASEAVLMDFPSHRLAGKWVEVKRATPATVLQAVMENQMGAYIMDSTGWDSCAGACGIVSPVAATARGHARGRRGRRRKQRPGAGEYNLSSFDKYRDWLSGVGAEDQSGSEEDDDEEPLDPTSPCVLTAAKPVLRSPGGSPLAVGHMPRHLPAATVGRAGSGIGLASSDGSSEDDPGLVSLFPDASSENDPGRANVVTPKPGFIAGPNASPMKVACRDDRCEPFGRGDWLEGFTREDFLSLEVRPWLSAW